MTSETNTTARDEAFAVFCEQGAIALEFARTCHRYQRPVDAMLAALQAPVQPSDARYWTGYMGADERRKARHRLYCDGLRTSMDRTARDMAARKAAA